MARRRKARVIRASRPKKPSKKPAKKKTVAKKRKPSSSRRATVTRPPGLAAGISSSIHVAKYDGVCEACGRPIQRGAAIRWNGYTRKPRHADCSLVTGEPQVTTPAKEQPQPKDQSGEFFIDWRYLLHEDIPPVGAVVKHPDRGEIVVLEIVSEDFDHEESDWPVRLRCRMATREEREKQNGRRTDETVAGDG